MNITYCLKPPASFILSHMKDWKDNISFTLIHTLETGNIGASARALKNLGFSKLELVRPGAFPSEEAGWFAHGADDVLSSAKVYPDLASALRNKSAVIGSTRRTGKRRGIVYPVREAADRIRQLAKENRVALLFGREDRGLTNDEVAECSFMVHIPASSKHPSFNLAQAVLIIAYEISCADFTADLTPPVISNEEFAYLFQRLRRIMKKAGYAPKGIRDNEDRVMHDLKRLIARAGITDREARMLHGIISQLETGLTGKTIKKRK